jgi:hypothetical protein
MAAAQDRPAAGIRQGKDHRDGRLHRKVDWEEPRLQSSEVRPVEDLVGDYAIDKRLVNELMSGLGKELGWTAYMKERGSKQCAVTMFR